MAYKLIKREYSVFNDAFRHEYICDSTSDIANLPKCCAGSVAVIADKGGAIYMVNASGEWKEQ